jgi:arabinan endo-1,5-alpha-L-arabinosidase
MIFVSFILFLSSLMANYTNPVINRDCPDPTVIRASTGEYYVYSTQSGGTFPVYRSSNLVKWERVGTYFTNDSRPSFLDDGHVWAPDINYIDGQYVLYYALSNAGEMNDNGIGRAVSDRPEGPFEDLGPLFRSSEIGVRNSIDEVYFEEEGKSYLAWGSFNGIFIIELESDGLNLKSGATKRQIAGNSFEGSIIHKRGKYYYLIAAVGSCCEGLTSTYKIVVGRGTSLFGPYVDKSGKEMMSEGYTVVVRGNDRFKGPGHTSKIVQDDAGNDWILYHSYDADNADAGRLLMVDRVFWDDEEWPYMGDGTPSLSAEEPVF